MLIDSLVKGGRERRLIELLKGFKNYKDLEVALVIFSKKVEYPEVFQMGITIHFLERKPKKDPRVFLRLIRLCKQENPDILHSWGTMPSIYAIPAATFLGIKFINASIANAPQNIGWKYPDFFRSKITYPFCDAVVGNSKAGLEAYQAPAHKSHCMYNGFDFNRIKKLENPDIIKARYKILPGLITGMVGAFFDRKDYHTYIQTAIDYLHKRSGMTFLAIGDGPNLPRFKAMIPDVFKDRILFTGMVDEVESLVNIFDIGVLSTYTEGISNSIMEYMVLQKPVIATDGGGTKELVVDGETGFLVPQKDCVFLLKKIEQLANDPDLRRSFGQNGRARIKQYFSLDRMEKDYYALYHRLLNVSVSHAELAEKHI